MKKFVYCFLLMRISCSAFDQTEIDETVSELLTLLDVPGTAVGIVVDGKVVLSKGYGIRNKEKNLPVNPKTMFPVGSTTKAFTSFLIGQLVDKNVLGWDDRVSDHIPYFKLKDPYTTYNVTIRDYLTHTSGYPCHDAIWYNETYSRSEMIKRLRYIDPIYNHREQFLYQNIGYMIVGHAAEVAMQKNYETLIEENILKPLDMNHTTFSVASMQKNDNFAKSYTTESAPIPFLNLNTIAPAGGLNSNLEDLLKWTKLLLNDGGELISSDSFHEMIQPQTIGNLVCNGRYGLEDLISMEAYGLGWMLLSYRGHFLVLHGGNATGFSSAILFLPKEKLGIVVLCNKNLTPFPFILSSLLIDKFLDLPYYDWTQKYKDLTDYDQEEFVRNQSKGACENRSDAPFSHPLSEYSGVYFHPGYGKIELSIIKEKLIATYNQLQLPLEHCSYNVFEVSKEAVGSAAVLRGVKFSFGINYFGDIKVLSIPLEPLVEPIVFIKQNNAFLSDPNYLNEFAGKYSYKGFTINVEHAEGKLIAKSFGRSPYILFPEKKNHFKVKDLDGYVIEFLSDIAGAIIGVQLIQPDGTSYVANKIH